MIVDDEPWARTRIASLLGSSRDFQVTCECASGEEAIEAISTLSPDVVFLDVQMPEVDGFDVIDAVGIEAMPVVVFATAYDCYTLKAFDAGAFDYLLKPFDEERFQRTLERVRRRLQTSERDTATLRRLVDSLRRERGYLERLVVSAAGRLIFLRTAEIDWLEASGNYVTVHVGQRSYLLRETLSALEAKLDPAQFLRLHRSAIVNVDRIRQLEPWSRGEQVVVLQDGTQVTIGRTFRARLMALIRNSRC